MSQIIKDQNVIIISSIDWNFNWQGPQEIALRLAKVGNRVLFVENTGVRRPAFRDLGRIWKRLAGWRSKIGSNGFVQAAPNLFLCSPIVLPPFGKRLQKYLNQRLFFPYIAKIAKRLEMRDPIILTFLPTDTAGELIKTLRGDKSRVFYYVASDFAELVSNPADLSVSEREIVKICDAVLTICPDLTNRYRALGAKVHTIPYGVDLSVFQSGDHETPRSGDDHAGQIIAEIDRIEQNWQRVVGYVGAFHRHVNVELLTECAGRKKDWLWVFVGPVVENPGELKNLPNVLFAGAQPHKSLSDFIKRFDVCIIPYRRSKYTETVVPVKLNEYLAAGKTVVATDIPAVRDFNESHDVIKISPNRTADFLQAIEEALAEEQSAEIVEKRKAVAALSDWKIHFDNICRILNSDLSESRSENNERTTRAA